MPGSKNQDIVILSKSGKEQIKLDYSILRKAVLTLRAINHPLRKQMITLLEENNQLTVTDIFIKLRLEQSVVSQHLAILRKAGVLNTIRDGKFIHYSLNKERLEEISQLITELGQ